MYTHTVGVFYLSFCDSSILRFDFTQFTYYTQIDVHALMKSLTVSVFMADITICFYGRFDLKK